MSKIIEHNLNWHSRKTCFIQIFFHVPKQCEYVSSMQWIFMLTYWIKSFYNSFTTKQDYWFMNLSNTQRENTRCYGVLICQISLNNFLPWLFIKFHLINFYFQKISKMNQKINQKYSQWSLQEIRCSKIISQDHFYLSP
jgi:hypothetical protein